MNAQSLPHSFSMIVKARVTKEAPDVLSGLAGLYVKPRQAVIRVTKLALKKILILGKRDAAKPMKQRNDVSVLNSENREVPA